MYRPTLHINPVVSVAFIIVMLFSSAALEAAHAQTDQRCFPETGFCIVGRIREYWEQNGGIPVFGYPIEQQRQELIENNSLQVQWFERNRIELHPENEAPYDVLLGRLGEDRLRQTGRNWRAFPTSTAQPNCHYIAETKHNICGDILTLWRANGIELDGISGINAAESISLFGQPLSDLQPETINGQRLMVQWFERARLEIHPTPAPVLLGLLGVEYRSSKFQTPTPIATPTKTPTPIATPTKTPKPTATPTKTPKPTATRTPIQAVTTPPKTVKLIHSDLGIIPSDTCVEALNQSSTARAVSREIGQGFCFQGFDPAKSVTITIYRPDRSSSRPVSYPAKKNLCCLFEPGMMTGQYLFNIQQGNSKVRVVIDVGLATIPQFIVDQGFRIDTDPEIIIRDRRFNIYMVGYPRDSKINVYLYRNSHRGDDLLASDPKQLGTTVTINARGEAVMNDLLIGGSEYKDGSYSLFAGAFQDTYSDTYEGIFHLDSNLPKTECTLLDLR
jgi:hypothetical protein